MRTILVIDNEPEIADAVRASVPEYMVLSALDGIIGLDMLREHHRRIDLILLDIMMPRLDGQTTLLRIHSLYPHIPVRIFSGYADALAESLSKDLTGLPPMSKPLSLEELHHEINQSIGRKVMPVHQSGVFQYADQQAMQLEMQGRAELPITRILVCGPNRIVKNGLIDLLEPAGLYANYIQTNVLHIGHFSLDGGPMMVVTLPDDFQYALSSNIPVMCICTGLVKALRVLDWLETSNKDNSHHKTAAIIVDVDDSNHYPAPNVLHYIRSAFEYLGSGRSFVPDQLFLPMLDVQGRNISTDEAKLIRYELIDKDTKEIALYLGVSTDSVRQMRSRLAKKLDAAVADWPRFVDQWWKLHYP